MTRNLKAFGLALVAAMALGAIGAQGASAVVEHSFRSAVNPVVLTGHIHSGNHIFQATGGLNVECSVATFEGTQSEGTTADHVKVKPTYSSCEFLEEPATVDTKGCEYTFDSETTPATGHSTSQEHAAVSLTCEPDHKILVTTSVCNLEFNSVESSTSINQSMHGVTYTNVASDGPASKHAITVNATVKTIHYRALPSSFCGLGGHAAGTYTNGSYTGKAIVTGYEESTSIGSTTNGQTWTHGAQVDITISTPT